jgi:uncharacterized membrane protein
MLMAALTFGGLGWWWVAVIGAAVLLPLSWFALQPAGQRSAATAVGLGLRVLGIGLLLLCLLDPQWTGKRPRKGANLVAVVADNSQGLQIVETGETLSRGEQLRASLTGDKGVWLGELADTFQVRAYAFDRDMRRVRDFSELNFQGDRTAIGRMLARVRERFSGEPLAGVVLLTDGNATDLAQGLPELAGLPPIYPVVVGRDGGVRDIRVARADIRQSPFDDTPVTLQVEVAGQGAGSSEVVVKVSELAAGPAGQESGAASGPPPALPPAQTLRLGGTGAVDATFSWQPRGVGVRFYEVTAQADAKAGPEATLLNNRRTAVIDRGRAAYRILYVSGRPNWDYKFFNRALAEDPQLQMIGLIRVARREPKFEFKGRAGEATNPLFRGFGRSEDETARYDQPVLVRINARDEAELRSGFPRSAEELFAYDAVVVDDLEAAFFSTDQQALLRRFVAERGGGLLMLGGPESLDHGGYDKTVLAATLPFYLDRSPRPDHAGDLKWKLTREGWVEPWARVRPLESDERVRLGQMPPFQVLNPLSGIKPGATVLATVTDKHGTEFPALAAQSFGSGRVAAMPVGDLWRWGMLGETERADLEKFWRQLSRWLVSNVPSRVTLRAEPSAEDGRVRLRVTARDAEYRPLESGTVRVTLRRIAAPGQKSDGFSQATVQADPVPDQPGVFSAAFNASDAGAYLAEAEVLDSLNKPVGRAEAGWVNDPASAEFQSLEPNWTLLAELARRTGGEVLTLDALRGVAERLSQRPAPAEEVWSYPVWHRSGIFLLVLACFLTEWGWRRWKGLP